jgi:glucans biosynthesis protein C
VVTWPVSSLTDEHLMSLRPGAWPQGVVLFALGVLAGEASGASGRGGVEVGLDRRAERRWGWLTAGALVALVAVIVLGSRDGDLAALLHEMAWPGVSFALLYGLVSVSFSLWCLSWFGRRWTGSRSWSEPAGRASYATYLLHPLVLTGVMVAAWWLPGRPEIKFLVVVLTGVPVCFLAGLALTALPGARRVL